MMNSPIYNPPNPYCGLVPGGGLQTGILIKVNGRATPSANQFAVNLQLGPRVNPRDDLALHLSPIFMHPQRVVRNSLQNLTWGVEESHGGFPFSQGGSFEIIILVEYNCYKIAVNGYHFTEFNHRLPFSHVSHLIIDGDVQINSILFEMLHSGSSPRHQPSNAPMPPYPATSGSAGMPPYPNQPGGQYGQPPMPPQMGSFPTTGVGYAAGAPNMNYQQPYPSAYPTQAGMPPNAYPNAYPSTSAGYGMQAPPGYVGKPKKNKGIFSGSGLLPAAGAVGGTILGASLLSRAIPKVKMFKGPKFFKHKGFKHKGFGFGGKSAGFFGKGPKFGKFGKFKGPKFKGPKW